MKKESDKPDSPPEDKLATAPERAKRPGRQGPRDNGIRDDDAETMRGGFSYEVDDTAVFVFTSLEGGSWDAGRTYQSGPNKGVCSMPSLSDFLSPAQSRQTDISSISTSAPGVQMHTNDPP